MSDETERTDPHAASAPPPRDPPRVLPGGASRGGRRGARLLVAISVVGLVTTIGVGVGAWFFFQDQLAGSGGGAVVDDAYLEVRLTAAMTDAPAEGGLFFDPAQMPLLLTDVTADIRAAATDPSVKGLYLEIESVGGGWAQVQELRDAVTAFVDAGKPCHAWANGYDNKSYYLASSCKEVYLAPAGIFLVNGFAVTNEYYTGTLEKLGVDAEFEHVGDFKTAIEPFERSGPSPAADEAMNSMLDSLYGQMLRGVAASRGQPEEALRALVDRSPITPQAAFDAGLVDGLRYRDEVREGLAGEERTSLRAYHKSRNKGDLLAGTHPKIAVVHAEGAITSGKSSESIFGGRSVGDETMEEILTDIREDDRVSAVVLRVNSPGGSGLASDNIWRQVALTREAGKPVVVSMGDYAASGGYYIAAGADHIVAEPGTLTGSIGVFGGKMNLRGLYEKVGVSLHTWQRGELANLLSSTSGFNEAERAQFRGFLQGFYDIFLARVAAGRDLSTEAVHAVAQGRVWTGEQALAHGLVDELGGLETAVAKAKELGGIGPDDKVTVERFPRQKTFFEVLQEQMQPEAAVPAELALVPELARSWSDLLLLGRVLEDGGVAAMLPGRIEIR